MLTEAVTEVPILVSSQDRTLAFHAGTLGLELVRADDSVLGVRWIQAHLPRDWFGRDQRRGSVGWGRVSSFTRLYGRSARGSMRVPGRA